ncbi:hypothetical protein D3C71_2106290 [compost metagenome]
MPTNSRAEVRLPARSADNVRENGRPLSQTDGVVVRGLEGDRLVLEVGSGDYRFLSRA